MRASIVRIGNSRGVRIPKAILAACGIDDAVDLSVSEGKIILTAPSTVRQGWAEVAEEMARCHDDDLIDPIAPTRFDADEWEW